MSEVSKIMNWCREQRGSSQWSGKCQAFVSYAIEAGTGKLVTYPNAKAGRLACMKAGTKNDFSPPAGAACYFNGSGRRGASYGHVGVSDGNGNVWEAWSSGVFLHDLREIASTNGGYLGWGWHGGIQPDGAKNGMETSNGTTDNSGVSSAEKTKNVEISAVTVQAESGTLGAKQASALRDQQADSELFLLLQHKNTIYRPLLADNVRVTRERFGAPGKLVFYAVDVDGFEVAEGDAVAFRYRNDKIFYGYVFTVFRDSDREKIQVTCYDQLRYFKNPDSFVYSDTYTGLLKMICAKYSFSVGEIDDTGYRIPTRLEDGTLFDICDNASGLTTVNTGKCFVLYDDFGEICLKELSHMALDIYLDHDTAGKWEWKSSIDSDTFNRIVVKSDNRQTGERNLIIVNDTEKQQKWGVLVKQEDGGDWNETTKAALQAKADALLRNYACPQKTFRVTGCLGDSRVRGGSMFAVSFDLANGEKIQNQMVVDKVEHSFSDGQHLMELNLIGGDYSA